MEITNTIHRNHASNTFIPAAFIDIFLQWTLLNKVSMNSSSKRLGPGEHISNYEGSDSVFSELFSDNQIPFKMFIALLRFTKLITEISTQTFLNETKIPVIL